MDKFLSTFKSGNRKTGPILITTSPRSTSIDEADELADLAIAPVTIVLPAHQTTNSTTPKGRTVVICPAIANANMTCARCGICATQRKAIIAFPAHGPASRKITA